MSAPVMAPPAGEAELLERLEAEFLRSPSPTWPVPTGAVAVAVDLPTPFNPDQPGGPDAYVSRYRTYGLCCKY